MGRNLVLSAGSSILAVVALVVGVVAVATPYWATFEDGRERGHFGPWTVCRQRLSEFRCGSYVSRLQPSEYTTAAGVCGVVSVVIAVLLCVTSPLVLAMRVTHRQVFLKFRTAVLVKLVISCLGVTSGVLALILFGIDLDARRLGEDTGFRVTRAWSFYLLVLFLLLSLTLCAFAAAEFVLARRLGGDPVKIARDPSGSLAPVYANPAARDVRGATRSAPPPAGNGVTVIVAQQPKHVQSRPTATVATNGRWAGGEGAAPTPAATRQSADSGRPVPYDPRKSPLRSSLKKKRPAEKRESSDDSVDSGVVIIQNAAAVSPALTRSKKVRIQTLDTAV